MKTNMHNRGNGGICFAYNITLTPGQDKQIKASPPKPLKAFNTERVQGKTSNLTFISWDSDTDADTTVPAIDTQRGETLLKLFFLMLLIQILRRKIFVIKKK